MNITVDERASAAQAGRALAAKVYRAATTDQPQPARVVAAARFIGRLCAVVLIALGVFYAATSTWQGDLIAVYTLVTGTWCWRHQRGMRGTR